MQPDIQVVPMPLAALLPYAANARTHSDEQVAQIAASITEFGFVNPVLVDDAGVLIAGHGRVMAAKSLGLETAPAIRLGHLTEAQARAYRLADNQLALNAGWDAAMLRAELLDLDAMGFNMGLVGFGQADLAAMMAGGDGEVDEAAADVARLLNDAKPHLMATDPPYGVNYDPAWRNRAGVSATERTGMVANDHRADWREAWALFPGEVAYIWHSAVHAHTVMESVAAAEFVVRSQIIWAKKSLVMGRGTITGSTSRASTSCARTAPGTGKARGTSRSYGRSPRAATPPKIPRRCTARRSRWNACAVRSSTTQRRVMRSMSRSPVAARR